MQNVLIAGLESHYTGRASNCYRSRHLGVGNEMVYAAIARQRARKLQPHINPKDRVFEYGVGSGFNLAALRCREKVGYDLFDNSPELARRGIRFCYHTAQLRGQRFDVALCMHTLEHVVNPWQSLMEMRRVLRNGGRLIVCVPYEIGRAYHHFDPSNLHQHIFSWNPQTLGMLLTKAGFELEKIGVRRFGYDRFTARLPGGARSNLIYRLENWLLLQLRPHYEVMAICTKPK